MALTHTPQVLHEEKDKGPRGQTRERSALVNTARYLCYCFCQTAYAAENSYRTSRRYLVQSAYPAGGYPASRGEQRTRVYFRCLFRA